MRSTVTVAAVLSMLLAGVLPALGQDVSFPVDDIEGPVCVLHDTARGVAFTMSPVHSKYNLIVTDGLAHMRLTQMFVNEYGDIRDIVYVFPLPHNGAVHAMSMEYRDSLYVARIYEKEEAQQIYDSVAASGGTAALLLQERPNVFQQHLANIAVGDTAWVRIDVSMPLKYVAGTYELAVPTMIGCRYPSAGADPVSGCSGWNPPPDRDGQSLEFNVLIQTGYEVHGLESPTHTIDVMSIETARPILEQRSLLTADTELPMPYNLAAVLASAQTYPNSDFVLRFSRTNAARDFSVASYFEPDRSLGHFALSLFPDTTQFIGPRPDLEIVLLIDISGSQTGWPIAKEKEICHSILDRLLPTDRLTVLSFNTMVTWCFGNSLPVDASAGSIATAREFIDGLAAGGGTNLLQGVTEALSAPATTEHERYYIFLTDGFITNEEAIFDTLRNHPTQPTVFTFGAGNNLNRYFLEQAAAIGNGFATEITEYESVEPKVDQAWERIESPQLRNVSVDFGGLDVSEILMPLGSSLYRGGPLTIYGAYRTGGLRTVTVTGYRDGAPVQFSEQVTFAHGRNLNRMVPQVWARHKIEQLVIDEGNTTDNKDSIIAISIEYQVLSKYTAFLAVSPTSPINEAPRVDSGAYIGLEAEPGFEPARAVRTALEVRVEKSALQLLAPSGAVIEQMSILDLRGRVLYTVQLDRREGVMMVRWDGRLGGGALLPVGRYVVRVKTDRGWLSASVLWRG